MIFLLFVLALKVECHGPGLEATGNVTNKPAEFTVDTRRAGSAPLEISVSTPEAMNLFPFL